MNHTTVYKEASSLNQLFHLVILIVLKWHILIRQLDAVYGSPNVPCSK